MATLTLAQQYSGVIHAAQDIPCPTDPRFRHLIDNDLDCARCRVNLTDILNTATNTAQSKPCRATNDQTNHRLDSYALTCIYCGLTVTRLNVY